MGILDLLIGGGIGLMVGWVFLPAPKGVVAFWARLLGRA